MKMAEKQREEGLMCVQNILLRRNNPCGTTNPEGAMHVIPQSLRQKHNSCLRSASQFHSSLAAAAAAAGFCLLVLRQCAMPQCAQYFACLYMLTSKCASCHNGVHFFNIATFTRALNVVCFVHFDLEMCFAPHDGVHFMFFPPKILNIINKYI